MPSLALCVTCAGAQIMGSALLGAVVPNKGLDALAHTPFNNALRSAPCVADALDCLQVRTPHARLCVHTELERPGSAVSGQLARSCLHGLRGGGTRCACMSSSERGRAGALVEVRTPPLAPAQLCKRTQLGATPCYAWTWNAATGKCFMYTSAAPVGSIQLVDYPATASCRVSSGLIFAC